MLLISAAWAIFPWYVWGAILLGIVAMTALGLWPVVWLVLKNIPLPVYLIVGAGFAAAFWLSYHDKALEAAAAAHEKIAVTERDTYWQTRETAANARYATAMDEQDRKLAAAAASAQAAATQAATAAAKARADRAADARKLAELRSLNVTAQADADCSLTRGVVLQFNAAASRANGSPAGDGNDAAGSGGLSVDAPAGVALHTFSVAVEDTQRALGTCRDQVIGWQRYYSTVLKPWAASTLSAFASCIPKGTP